MDWLDKNKKTLAIGGGVAGGVALAVTGMMWAALASPEPPLEKAGDDGLRIRLVEPPKAAIAAASPLDVGLSEAAQAMAKGKEALFPRDQFTPPPRLVDRPRPAPPRQVQVADQDLPPPEPTEDSWRREAERQDRLEQARRRQWEAEALAREAAEDRAAWEREMRERRRWEERRDEDRYDPRYAPPPDDDRWPEPRR